MGGLGEGFVVKACRSGCNDLGVVADGSSGLTTIGGVLARSGIVGRVTGAVGGRGDWIDCGLAGRLGGECSIVMGVLEVELVGTVVGFFSDPRLRAFIH